MPQKTARLSPLQYQAIDLLSTGKTVTSCCELLDIDRKTIQRWKKSEPFTQALDDRIAQASKQAMSELRALKGEAVGTLRLLMSDPETPANVRATIAFKLLDIPEPTTGTPQPQISEPMLQEIRQRVYGIFD